MFTEQTVFSSGTLWGRDSSGSSVKFGTLQDVSLDFSLTQKELRGQKMFAEKVGNSEGKISGKAKMGRINPNLFNRLFFNGTLNVGRVRYIQGEAKSVPANPGPYTVVVANGATFKENMGVIDATTGQDLELVAAGGEAAGKYSVNEVTGTYTFAAADTNRALLFDYSYTDAASGHTIQISNELSGLAPHFEVHLTEKDDSGEFSLKLNACVSSKLALATKMGDFMIPEFDFSAQQDAAGNIGEIYTE